jgi:hypothetical protein
MWCFLRDVGHLLALINYEAIIPALQTLKSAALAVRELTIEALLVLLLLLVKLDTVVPDRTHFPFIMCRYRDRLRSA